MSKIQIFLLLILTFFIISCEKKSLEIDSSKSVENKIIIGEKLKINSKILGEEREIWVNVPSDSWHLPQIMPVVYVLDGDLHFYSVMGMIQQLSQANSNNVIPKMITVGILNTNRTRDLTTSVDTSETIKSIYPVNGEAEKFMSFIEKELIHYIDSAFMTAPYRVLIGHSFGGLTVINALHKHNNLFNAFIAIDPSMSWDNQKLMKEISLSNQKYNNKSLYLAMANTFVYGKNINSIKGDTGTSYLYSNFHPRSIFEFTDILKSKEKLGLTYKFKYYENDDHCSVPLIAEYDAFRFIFNYYKPPSGDDLIDTNVKKVDSVLISHYKKISDNLGYTILPSEQLVNEYGYGFLGLNFLEKSYQCFKLNINNFPNSYNVYDSMGEYYRKIGDKDNAIKMFEKSLEIKENGYIKEKLVALKNDK